MFCEYLTGVCLRHFHFIKLKNFLYCIHTICITHYMYTVDTYYHLLVIIHHSCQNMIEIPWQKPPKILPVRRGPTRLGSGTNEPTLLWLHWCNAYGIQWMCTHDSHAHLFHLHSRGHHRNATRYQYTDVHACSETRPLDKICFDLQPHRNKSKSTCVCVSPNIPRIFPLVWHITPAAV